MPSIPNVSALRERYEAESARIHREFEATADGGAASSQRTALIDSVICRLIESLCSGGQSRTPGFALIALGGYGRLALFPHSDLDLLFLCERASSEKDYRQTIAIISQALWDLRLKLSPTTRTLAECDDFKAENAEFSISLLDCRRIAGDPQLFTRLRDSVIPQMVARERRDLIRRLNELTRNRHAKHGNTVFHLEPNIKEAPGGLRDYNLARWLVLISELQGNRAWAAPQTLWPSELREKCLDAFRFLCAVRTFIHYRHGRDDNRLSYELQDAAASLGIGIAGKRPVAAADWMRTYFRYALAVHHLAELLTEEIPPAHSSLYEAFEDWRSRLSTSDVSVVREQIFLRPPSILDDVPAVLRLFEFMARHGLSLSSDAEGQIERRLVHADRQRMVDSDFWPVFAQILALPHAASALRAMHRIGLLVLLFPEFEAIDSLVVRDFYHRYTVDEHSFLAIENLHRLRHPENNWERKFQEILEELEQPELLCLSLLLHDIGKGMPGTDHVQESLRAAGNALARLSLLPEERDTVRYLIGSHLEMSATMQRRDIFDPQAICEFARIVGTPERLKLLCLFTYADIRSVNPEALTPWKAEALWQLYAATANYLSRGVDKERIHEGDTQITAILSALTPDVAATELAAFLEGFPRRYLASHSAGQIASHYQMSLRIERQPFQLELTPVRGHYALTLLAHDRPRLFAAIAGTLHAWGMTIKKVEAFASSSGIVLDTFHFVDLFRTLELNPLESERLKESILEVLTGKQDLQLSLARRPHASGATPKVRVETQIRFDGVSSAHSTIVEIIAQDRPGLLYQISSVLAEAGYNIEVALIDTEGVKAIDVFYLTSLNNKLTPAQEAELRATLARQLD